MRRYLQLNVLLDQVSGLVHYYSRQTEVHNTKNFLAYQIFPLKILLDANYCVRMHLYCYIKLAFVLYQMRNIFRITPQDHHLKKPQRAKAKNQATW